MTRRWAPEVETAAWFGPHAAPDGRSLARSALAKLKAMPTLCEWCGGGRPVCVLGADERTSAVCASCRGATNRVQRQAGERRQCLADAETMTAALNAQTQRGMRARRLTGYIAVLAMSTAVAMAAPRRFHRVRLRARSASGVWCFESTTQGPPSRVRPTAAFVFARIPMGCCSRLTLVPAPRGGCWRRQPVGICGGASRAGWMASGAGHQCVAGQCIGSTWSKSP